MITKFKKKPVIIEAIQLKGDSKTIKECLEFMGQSVNEDLTIERNKFEDYCLMVNEKGMKISTLEGEMTASINDYIIKGIKGEFYPCKPDIFEQTYEQADNKNGIDLIRKERDRQINEEGWDINSDIKEHDGGELGIAGACYALPIGFRYVLKTTPSFKDESPDFWPWDNAWWKPTPDNRIKELIKAGALIAAEIDRLLAIETPQTIPTNLEECFDHINEWFDKGVFNKRKLFNNLSEDDFVITNHRILGLKIRNEWELWKGTSKLFTFFNDMKISHPDDMSGIILTSYFRKMNNQDIKLDEQIENYLTYWNNNLNNQIYKIN